jgi:hypothetical protein
MDANTTTVIAYSGFLLSLATGIITAINHKRIRSSCCKKKLEVSIDIENTSPIIDDNNKRHIPAQVEGNV